MRRSKNIIKRKTHEKPIKDLIISLFLFISVCIMLFLYLSTSKEGLKAPPSNIIDPRKTTRPPQTTIPPQTPRPPQNPIPLQTPKPLQNPIPLQTPRPLQNPILLQTTIAPQISKQYTLVMLVYENEKCKGFYKQNGEFIYIVLGDIATLDPNTTFYFYITKDGMKIHGFYNNNGDFVVAPNFPIIEKQLSTPSDELIRLYYTIEGVLIGVSGSNTNYINIINGTKYDLNTPLKDEVRFYCSASYDNLKGFYNDNGKFVYTYFQSKFAINTIEREANGILIGFYNEKNTYIYTKIYNDGNIAKPPNKQIYQYYIPNKFSMTGFYSDDKTFLYF